MIFNKTNVIVSGSRSSLGEFANYTTVFPKPVREGDKIVLTQNMINKPNVKYVIKWNFDLSGEIINIPENCLIEFDGGSVSNGTLVGNNTTLICTQPIDDAIKTSLEGTWNAAYLSQDWGNSKFVGISQKKLTEAHNDLQNQINAIINDKAEVSLTVSPSPVFVGMQSGISLQAETNTQASSIKIKKGATQIAVGSGLVLNGSDSITPSVAGNITYNAEFIIAGLTKTTSKAVVAVYPIYYGTGTVYTDATAKASARITPVGTYTVEVHNNEDYVFFVVPSTMTINKATMSGFDFPLQAPVSVNIGGVAYKSYKSSNTYDIGTLTIVIS